jgi:hypothetical protein
MANQHKTQTSSQEDIYPLIEEQLQGVSGGVPGSPVPGLHPTPMHVKTDLVTTAPGSTIRHSWPLQP